MRIVALLLAATLALPAQGCLLHGENVRRGLSQEVLTPGLVGIYRVTLPAPARWILPLQAGEVALSPVTLAVE